MKKKVFVEERKKSSMTVSDIERLSNVSRKSFLKYDYDDNFEKAMIKNVIRVIEVFNSQVEEWVDYEQIEADISKRLKVYNETHVEDRKSFKEVSSSYYNTIYSWYRRKQIDTTDYQTIYDVWKCETTKFKDYMKSEGLEELTDDKMAEYKKVLDEYLVDYSPLLRKRAENDAKKRILYARLKKGYSIEKVAYCMDMSEECLRSYETGKRNIMSISTIQAVKMCCMYDCRVNDIFKSEEVC